MTRIHALRFRIGRGAAALAAATCLLPVGAGADRAAAQGAGGAGGIGADRAALVSAIDSIAEAALRDGPIPGISIAVVRGGDTLALRGYGFADLEHDVPAGAQTVYRIGSITKQFTAAALMRLVEQGRVSLRDPLSRHLPDLPPWGDRVTIHHLLNHTSGVRSYTSLGPKWQETMPLDRTHEEMLALFRDEPFDFEPGEKWLYNNSGYYLAGMVLERVTGQSYADHLRETFFEPLGLEGTHYCSGAPLIEHRAAGYEVDGDGFRNAPPLSMTQPFAAGALCSTVGDLVTWTGALVAGRVVSPESFRRMTDSTTLADGGRHPYGYGLSSGALSDRRVVSHGGGINGFITYLSYYPDADLTVAVLTNSGGSNPARIERSIARRVLGIPEPVAHDLPTTAAQRARYVGEYDLGVGRIRVREEGDRLHLEGPVDSALLFQGDHTFLAESDPDVRLSFRLEEGRAVEVVLSIGGDPLTGTRVR